MLNSSIAVMDEILVGFPRVESLLQRVERQVGPQRRRDAPTHDPTADGIVNEGDVDEARPGRDVCDVGEPESVRGVDDESTLHSVEPVRRRRGKTVVRARRPRTAPDSPISHMRR